MKTFRFEIQKCMDCEVEAETAEAARMKLMCNLHEYAEDFIDDCYISEGVEVKDE